MDTIGRILELLEEKDVSGSKMSKDLGFSNAVFYQWKSHQQNPSADKVVKMADYFGVSVDYLLGKTDIKKAPAQNEQGRDGYEHSDNIDNLKFALFGGDGIDDIDDEMMEDVKAYARFKLEQKQKEKKKDKK